MSGDILKIESEPAGGNGRVILTARLGNELLLTDKVDIYLASGRDRFAKALCTDRPGIQRPDVDKELLAIAASMQAQARRELAGDERELDLRRIVRPERFICPEVSGLTVAVPMLRDGKPAGRWRVYLRWADGRREAMDLPRWLVLPDGARLWFHPVPGEPGIQQVPAWAEADRRAWLDGAPAPGR